MAQQTYQNQGIDLKALSALLEPLIRRIVREELQYFAEEHPGVVYLASDSPLYADLLDIAERKAQGALQLHDHSEVWGE